jgi:conjugative transfer signal peptidase TraF
MNTIFNHFTNWTANISIILLAVVTFLFILGLRINTTHSIPAGVYLEISDPIRKNSYVIFCPPPSDLFDVVKERRYIRPGFCKNGYGYMMKKVAATEGDLISINDEGVYVNKKCVPNSKPIAVDENNRSLPHYRMSNYRLKKSEALLLGETPISFDARYFGPIDISNVQSVIRPLFIWEKNRNS